MLPTTVAYDRSHQARLLRLLDIVLPVAHPDSNKRMAWNLGIMLLVFASALLVPFNLAFDDEFALETRRGFHVADMLFDCIFLFDILLNFRIGYDKDGFFVQDAYLVANPPLSMPDRDEAQRGRDLLRALRNYNTGSCRK